MDLGFLSVSGVAFLTFSVLAISALGYMLGRITVKLVTSGERVAVQITAENPETRQLLEARGENLQTVLKNGGVELERYQVVTDREEAQLMQDSYEGSSKNPYSRNNQQQNSGDDSGEDFYELLQSI